MEILNNIWNAISTPNDTIINIMLVFGVFIESFLILLLFMAILKLSVNVKTQIIYILITGFLILITLFIVPSPFNIFINYFLAIVLQYAIFKPPFVKSIIVHNFYKELTL